jgi:ubiquinone/menaquinone biosynthesis C-methylase UbiE
MSQEFFTTSYVTGTDSWSTIPYISDLFTMMQIVPKNSLVMDLGCGRGKTALDTAQSGYRVIGVDFIQGAIDRANKAANDRGLTGVAKFMTGDATALQFTDESFDAVVEIGLLHHMQPADRAAVISEVARTLKPGGHFISMALSRETAQFGDFRPQLSQDGDMARFGLYYHFFTANEIKDEVAGRMTVLSQIVATYQTKAYGADSLSFLFSVCRKPMPGESTIDLHSSIFK